MKHTPEVQAIIDAGLAREDALISEKWYVPAESMDEVIRNQCRWVKVEDGLPPAIRDYGELTESAHVLATDGKAYGIARCQVWKEDGGYQWVERGQDGYLFLDVTHWMLLPDFPQ